MKINKHSRGGFYTTLTINGKKNFIYGATEPEVDAKYTDMKYKHHQGFNVNDNPTLEEYMIIWYKAFKSGEGAIKTQKMYQNCINNHINPALGQKKVKEITGTQVQSLVNGITSSKSLAHKVRITLNQIFKQAIADRLISFNPVTSSKVVAPDEPKRKCLTPTQRELMLSILTNHRAFPIIYTILYTGMRMGEALGLLWKDINFDTGIIKVTKATEYDHSKPKTKDPKTKKGFRDIPMPEELLNYLKQYQKSVKKSLYVFPGHAGGPMGLTEMNRIWKSAQKRIANWFKNNEEKIRKEAKTKGKNWTTEAKSSWEKRLEDAKTFTKEHQFDLTFRLLRHTYCTGLYDAGVDEVSAAELMGHDVMIMREVYTHIQESRKQKTVIKLDSLYKEYNVIEIKELK